MAAPDFLAERVVVLMPTKRDGEHAILLLREAGIAGTPCSDLAALCRELRRGAGALLLTDEALRGDTAGQLAEAMREQPTWSVVPVVVVAREGNGQELELNPPEWLRGLITTTSYCLVSISRSSDMAPQPVPSTTRRPALRLTRTPCTNVGS